MQKKKKTEGECISAGSGHFLQHVYYMLHGGYYTDLQSQKKNETCQTTQHKKYLVLIACKPATQLQTESSVYWNFTWGDSRECQWDSKWKVSCDCRRESYVGSITGQCFTECRIRVWRTDILALFVPFSLLLLLPHFLVSPNVLVQVVTPHKPLVALLTHKSFLSSMSTQMSLQLIRASKTFSTEQPVADKWPFTCVPTQMGT